MKRKNIDAAREARLWIRDIIVPATGLVIWVRSNPEARRYVDDKLEAFANKFRKNPEIKIYK